MPDDSGTQLKSHKFRLSVTDVALHEESRCVFGWANIACTKSGETVIDSHGDEIPITDLENAAYEFVLSYRETGDMHRGEANGRLVESIVFTQEKCAAMGIPAGVVPQGWWVGFHIDDDEQWAKVKSMERRMFSIEGVSEVEEVDAA